ncbi:TIGR03943 family protein [Sphaerisporangium rubeum]|uniref:Putative repeat protein (TIGR03943 family) n=2 Tax=Sphaerisporangium rubeum TaxID=321317 RepID=A0A7X0M9X2_9ACTN|nr:putative repeat protein (TIGR03943 family) [Sphaerisporangium rubeum]
MNRMAQGLVLTLLGGALLRVSAFSTIYLNYVRPGFRPFLITAGVVVLVLGVHGLVQEWRRPYAPREKGHDDHGPGVAWLLCLPVVAIFLISPPALGAFAAGRDETPQARPTAATGSYAALTTRGPAAMPLGEFIGRAWGDQHASLRDRQVRLAGFVTPSRKHGQWYLTRMQLRCCAADAFPLRVGVLGVPAPKIDTWVEVTGTWVPTPYDRIPAGTVAPELRATSVVTIAQPDEPYE